MSSFSTSQTFVLPSPPVVVSSTCQKPSMKGYSDSGRGPHAVMVSLPTPGHMNPMLKLAKLLHSKDFQITFVVTESTHHRLRDSLQLDTLDGFRFETVPDVRLVSSSRDWMKYIEEFGVYLRTNFPAHFRDLLTRLKARSTKPVTCVVAGFMSSALHVAEEFGILKLLFWTSSACGFMGTLQIESLITKGYIPLKDEFCLRNGYLETELNWIPGMKGVRLKDITRFVRTTKHGDVLLSLEKEEAEIGYQSWGIILNTFDELESDVITALRHKFPRLYTLGSMSALVDRVASVESNPIHLSQWNDDTDCLGWLDNRKPSSVVYVNFGSITILTPGQLLEFANGLAASGHAFLWIIRPDLVSEESSVLISEFREKTRDRGYLTSWCCQEEVLAHPSVGCFLTHAGWNSVLESIENGIPMLCWPFFAEQPTNCRYLCGEWGIGMEIDSEVKREEVGRLVGEVMGNGEKSVEMRRKALVWKQKAAKAVGIGGGGTSYVNLENLVRDLKEEEIKIKCL